MRPLALSLLSGAASIAFGIASNTFLTGLDLTRIGSPATFTHLLTAIFCLITTLACLWVCLSYLLLAYAHHTSHRSSIPLRHIARFTVPHVRRHLLAAMTLSLVMAQPAYAHDYDSTPDNSSVDISWGSPDLLEIATQTERTEIGKESLETDTPAENHTETSTKVQPSPVPTTNPLTSPPTNTITVTDDNSPTEPSQRALSPPDISAPSRAPQNYTVKSGDTLWTIAATHLPPNATDGDVAQACLAWSTANPTLKNPHLIYPGQTLTIPQENLL